MEPLENDYDTDFKEEGGRDLFDPFETRKITIPLDPQHLKEKEHINVDINLRLIDFIPQHNRSMDDFKEDPLARYIKNYENSMSRSLPGSSGSFNSLNGKSKQPLPPLGQKLYSINKPHSNEDSRRLLQYEYDGESKSDGKCIN